LHNTPYSFLFTSYEDFNENIAIPLEKSKTYLIVKEKGIKKMGYKVLIWHGEMSNK